MRRPVELAMSEVLAETDLEGCDRAFYVAESLESEPIELANLTTDDYGFYLWMDSIRWPSAQRRG